MAADIDTDTNANGRIR